MKIIIDLANVPPIPIPLGKDEQNNFDTVVFDARRWGEDFPGATYTVLYQRPAGDIYPVLANRPGPMIEWKPSAADTTIVDASGDGHARAEVRLMLGDVLGKSRTVQFSLNASILSEAPDAPTPDWVSDVAENAAKAEAAASAAEDAAKRAEEAGGEVDPEKIAEAVEDYFDEHPIDVPTDAVLYTPQNLTPAQQEQARENIHALSADTQIPTAVTEQTVAGWGFTKNTGTYSKPSGGIPATDLAQAVQTILNNAVLYSSQARTDAEKEQARANIGAASRSDLGTVFTLKGGVATVNDLPQTGNRVGDVWYVENVSAGFIWITSTAYPNGYWEELGETVDLSAYAEKTWVEGKGFQTAQDVQTAIAAIPDELPAVTATDNGKSLVVENGVWGKGYQAARTPRVAMASTDTTPTLDPNKLYVFPEMASLAITLATPTDSTIVNEYHFIFVSGATPTTLTIPAAVKTPDGFTVDANMVYEVSILENNMTAMSWEVTA